MTDNNDDVSDAGHIFSPPLLESLLLAINIHCLFLLIRNDDICKAATFQNMVGSQIFILPSSGRVTVF